MKKGFLFTLIAIAFAFVQVTNTYATAPIVSDPGDIIVGDIEGATNPATGTNIFVYPDAFNLDDIVSDDATADDDIKWSFVDASGTITINGVSSLDPGLSGLNADDPTSPRASSRIDLSDDTGSGTSGSDSDMGTVTFRNALFTDGDPFAETVITLYASDCSTFSSRSIVVYTIDNTSDAISGTPKETILGPIDLTMGTAASNGWTGGVVTNTSGSSAVDGDSGNGLCMTAAATVAPGDESGWFTTANPYWDLAANTVYLITLDVTSDQTTPGAQPFWNLNVTNAANLHGADYWVIDIDGGANAVQAGGSTFRYAWAPASVGMPRWNDFLGTGAGDAAADPALLIRVIDGNPNIGFATDSGTICMTGLRIEAISRDAIAIDAIEEDGALDPSTHFAENNNEGAGNTPTFPAGGPMTFAPLSAGAAYANGTNDVHSYGYFDSANTNFSVALNPIVQQAQTLYRGVYGAVATGGTDITDGPDALFFNGTPTNGTEFAVSSFVTRGAGATEGVTSPGATPGVYEAYLFVNNVTTSATDSDRLSFSGAVTNTDVLFGTGNGGDDIDITSLRMDRLANIFN